MSHAWRGVSLLRFPSDQMSDWFSTFFMRKVGNDLNNKFLHDVWDGTSPL